MTLLITVIAAVICTAVWYSNEKARKMKTGLLCWLFWGASVMWLVDAFFEYAELHEEFFTPSAKDMLNDVYLGLSVVALALVIWVVYLLIRDPEKVIRSALKNNNRKD